MKRTAAGHLHVAAAHGRAPLIDEGAGVSHGAADGGVGGVLREWQRQTSALL
jgi:hypothetical protein